MTVSPGNQHRIVDVTVRRLRKLADDLAAGDGDETETVKLLREWARDLNAERGNLVWERRPTIPAKKRAAATGDRRAANRAVPEATLGPDFESTGERRHDE